MRLKKILPLLLGLCLVLSACGNNPQQTPNKPDSTTAGSKPGSTTVTIPAAPTKPAPVVVENAVTILLSDNGITVDGQPASTDPTAAVYTARDIVYYEAGKDFTYGEGTDRDTHTKEEADAHTVVHITKPGKYSLSGSLSTGQIAVDLGEDAKDDPNAVVTLVLNVVDINCNIAPAIIFYNVYECGSTDVSKATKDVDTTKAGANIILADGTVNNINGSYVARIYESVQLNAAGTEVISSKKLHKYDGAIYSKMSMNIKGGDVGDGKLNLFASNEGLGSELHLTMLGGHVIISSANDGINANEDNISVTTIKGGTLEIAVTGQSGEGDGIDSNGWLVIDGGIVNVSACGTSPDSGLDADKGVFIQGGTVVASGNMADHIETELTSVMFSFQSLQWGGNTFTLKRGDNTIMTIRPTNEFQYLFLTSPDLSKGIYQLYRGEDQLLGAAGSIQEGFGGMGKPGNMSPDALGESSKDFSLVTGYNTFIVTGNAK